MKKNKIQQSKLDERLVYFFGLTTPLFMVPQAVVIYTSKEAGSVSLITWSFFLLADIVWISYGLKHKLTPLVYSHVLYFIVELAIVIGALLYR